MKIVIPGGSGQVGTLLATAFHKTGDEVVVLSRNPQPADWKVVAWDAKTLGAWQCEFDAADVVINLAGRSVNCRYNAHNRQQIMDSRIDSARVVGQAIQSAKQPPPVWLQASTATIYSHRFDAPNDEQTGIIGGDELHVPDTWRFSIDVAKNWEQTALEIETPDTRKVLMRSAIVMNPDAGSAFSIMQNLIRCGLGGKNGSGKQFVSWIHQDDFIRAVRFLIDYPLDGPVNIASPHPLPNAEFMQTFRKACSARIGMPATKWMLELGAILLRTETELILKSRRVVPKRLIQAGFEFDYPDWGTAVRSLVKQTTQSS